MSTKTNTLSRSKLNNVRGKVHNIHYGDVLIKYRETLNAQKESMPYITNGTIKKYKAASLKDGDVVFADTAEDETAGKAVEIGNVRNKIIVSGLHTIVLRPIIEKAYGFWGYYFNSDGYRDQLKSLLQGTKVLSINKYYLSNTTVKIPANKKEKLKISEFLEKINLLITLHQRRCFYST